MKIKLIVLSCMLLQFSFLFSEPGTRMPSKKENILEVLHHVSYDKKYAFDAVNSYYDFSNIEETHFLGEEIAKKWGVFKKLYIQTYEMEIGFTNMGSEIAKPSVFKSVEKVNVYLKKSVKKGLISKEEAIQVMDHILDCANAIYYEPESKEFEKEVAGKKDPLAIISSFNSIRLNFI